MCFNGVFTADVFVYKEGNSTTIFSQLIDEAKDSELSIPVLRLLYPILTGLLFK